MASKRILYLQNILKRNEDELVKQVFLCDEKQPVKGGLKEEILQMSKTAFKTIVKTKMKRYVLDELNTVKGGHIKVSCIVHSDLRIPQKIHYKQQVL